MKRIKSAYFVWLTLLGSTAALAAPIPNPASGTDIPWRRVHYGDLDLTHDAGAAALYTRIRAAAQAVCPLQHSWAEQWLDRTGGCRFQAVARAVAEVNSPLLTSYYEAKTRSR